jgi:tRNA pseudouridine55 synthase
MEMLNGILVLNKPRGMTSHDCVSKIRRLAKTKRVGHTGTLDPEVTGVLPICIGHATRVAEYLLDYEKEYTAVISLGKSTTTQDQTGEVLEESPIIKAPSKEDLIHTLQTYVGLIAQVPPMYSAVKVNGKRLHQLARAGKEVERKSREVTIYNITLIEYNETPPFPTFKIKVRCSKGTYIRTLGVDIGKSLGYPAHMASLVRTKSGPYSMDESVDFETIAGWSEEEWERFLYPLDSAIQHLPKLVLSDDLIEKVKFGQSLHIGEPVVQEKLYRVYDQHQHLVALYIGLHSDVIKPKKVFLFE